MTESDSLIQSESNQRSCVNCQNHLCLQSKAAIVIVLWTVFVSATYTMIIEVEFAAVVVKNNHLHNAVTFPFSVFCAILAFIAILYPLIGLGRLKVVIFCFSLVLVSFTMAYIWLVAELILINYYHYTDTPSAILDVGGSAVMVTFVSLGGYQANFIQLGLDQQLSALSKNLALFVHWVMWVYTLVVL